MKTTNLLCISLLLAACGGDATPPAAAPSTTAAPSASTAPSSAVSAPAPTTPSSEVAAPINTPPAPPAALAKGNITGSVTSMPAAAAKNTVVYLEDGTKDVVVNASVDNVQMTFTPYVAVVTSGGTVSFINTDPFPHNVFSPDNEKFDIGMISQHATKTRKFDKAGVYTLLCNLHPNMKGYIVVVPSSQFAKTDAKGAFTIKDVAPGTYKVTAWGPGTKPVTQNVVVAGDVTSNFDLHR